MFAIAKKCSSFRSNVVKPRLRFPFAKTVESNPCFQRQRTVVTTAANRGTKDGIVCGSSLSNGMATRGFASSSTGNVVPFLLADIGEGITECELIQWFVKEGDRVEQFSKICEVQSDKAAVEITSRYDGVVTKLYYKPGDVAKVGSALVDITTSSKVSSPVTPSISNTTPAPPPAKVELRPTSSNHELTFSTPAVRRVAKEHNIDLRLVKGTGPDGRVLKGDVLSFVSQSSDASKTVTKVTVVPSSHEQAVSSAPVKDELVPLNPIQKAMFKSMTKSLQIPHFGFSDEVILDETIQYRSTLNNYLKENKKQLGYSFDKISYMPIFLKALSESLKQYPILNACVVGGNQQGIDQQAMSQIKLQYRSSHNIGIAMDTPQGLIVPNVKDVQSKSILEIAQELERLKQSSQKPNGISSQDLQGGTITISNVGNIGGTLLHPVLVSSEVCIGAIGQVQRVPRFVGESGLEICAKHVLHVSFNADHRVIDGATVARFVQTWKSYLENPSLLSARLK